MASVEFPNLARFDRVAADTETTGRGSRDRPVGCSLALPDGRDFYFAWGHRDGGNNCTLAEFLTWAKQELNREGLRLLFHNAGFDMRMLAYVGLELYKPKVEDTQFAAAILNELEPSFALDALATKELGEGKVGDEELYEYCAKRYGGAPTRRAQGQNIWKAPGDVVAPYAKGDARRTLQLDEVYQPRLDEADRDGHTLREIYELEVKLIPILLRMHMVGVRVDTAKAEELLHELEHRIKQTKQTWERLAPGVNYNSTAQLATLFTTNNLPVWRTDSGNPSITKDLLDLIDHPIANTIKEVKRLEKFKGTFIENYILKNVHEDGIVHGEFHPLKNEEYGTVSGRFSSAGELNLQNVPARDEEIAPLIRGLFIPYHSDQRWLKADYSQIEFRFLAHYAGGKVAQAYRDDPNVDFHQACAELVGIPRKPAKNINFGLVYGMGEKLMAIKLGLPIEEARELFEVYHQRLPEVRALYKLADRRAAQRGIIRTWGGRKRRFKKRGNGSHESTHKALNALLQGSAADLIKMSMVRIDEIVDWDNVLLHLTVHDELDFSIPEGEAGDRFVHHAKELMEDYHLDVPIVAECEVGPNWGDTEKWLKAA